MTKRTITLLFVSAVLVIAGVALSELVHPWAGVALLIVGTALVAWTIGQAYAEAANEELERLKRKQQEFDEMYADLRDKEDKR